MKFGTAINRYIAAFLVTAVIGFPALAQGRFQPKPLTQTERRVCQDLDFCVDLLLRHGPDEFDYQVLAAEFQRMGPAGANKLLKYAAGKSETNTTRAQLILSQPGWRFTPQEQRKIAALWPSGDIGVQADMMRRIGSPMMRNSVVATLLHEDPKIRETSRDILTGMNLHTDFALPSTAFNTLVRALVSDPTPEIITLIGTFPDPQSGPILRRTLLSGDPNSVMAAYDSLYKSDPKNAFGALMSALEKLETPDQALAISAMLQARHQNRQDGFYMKFARDLAGDAAQPKLVRMVGLDALMSQSSKPIVALPDTEATQAAYAYTLQQPKIALDKYAYEFQAKTGRQSAPYLELIWKKLKPGDEARYVFTKVAGQIGGTQSAAILQEALTDQVDWRVTQAAILGLKDEMTGPQKSAIEKLAKSHPIRQVRVAANAAVDAGKSGEINLAKWEKSLAPKSQYCQVKPTDFASLADQMPYFEDGRIAARNGELKAVARKWLSTAVAVKDGWLAGYRNGETGGLLFYDYATEGHKRFLDGPITAIVPTRKVKLGTTPDAVWIVAETERSGRLYRLNLTHHSAPQLRLHAQLPGPPASIHLAPDNSVQIGFGPAPVNHPPLRLLPGGGIIDGCTKPAPLPSNGALPN